MDCPVCPGSCGILITEDEESWAYCNMCLGKRKVHDYDFSIVERRRFEAENFCLHSIYKLNTARGAVTKYFKVEEFDPREDESVKKWSEWYAAESTSGKRSVSDSHGTISDGETVVALLKVLKTLKPWKSCNLNIFYRESQT